MSNSPRREAMLVEIEHAIDPDALLDPRTRRERAEAALHERHRHMGLRSGEARREKRDLRRRTARILDVLVEAGVA